MISIINQFCLPIRSTGPFPRSERRSFRDSASLAYRLPIYDLTFSRTLSAAPYAARLQPSTRSEILSVRSADVAASAARPIAARPKSRKGVE
jgi:hypothetical protein